MLGVPDPGQALHFRPFFFFVSGVLLSGPFFFFFYPEALHFGRQHVICIRNFSFKLKFATLVVTLIRSDIWKQWNLFTLGKRTLQVQSKLASGSATSLTSSLSHGHSLSGVRGCKWHPGLWDHDPASICLAVSTLLFLPSWAQLFVTPWTVAWQTPLSYTLKITEDNSREILCELYLSWVDVYVFEIRTGNFKLFLLHCQAHGNLSSLGNLGHSLCPALWDPMNCSPPGSFVHGLFQAKILKWVAISFSRGTSQPRDRTHIPSTGRRILYH